jgi:two-component system chemotaxis response regulator CheB
MTEGGSGRPTARDSAAEGPDSGSGSFDVVALVASAGGLLAVEHVLSQLPEDFGAAVVVVQHLSGRGSSLVNILRRHSPLPTEWIADHVRLKPGRVYVCPPRHLLKVRPDAECSLRPMEPGEQLRPIDFFLNSFADAYGPRGVAVVLTGMGRDSVAGCQTVSRAGGAVLVQSPGSAEHPGMPTAVIEGGAADLVLPLPELGQVLAAVISSGVLPLADREPPSDLDV